VVDVTLRAGKTVDLARLQRHFYAASSCGVCGKSSICAVRVHDIQRPAEGLRISPALLAVSRCLRDRQTVFDRTGGLHAAALFDESGALLDVREDVGRHNAVDKVIGRALLDGRLPLSQQISLSAAEAPSRSSRRRSSPACRSWRRCPRQPAWPSSSRASMA
jgi:FdhD protein